MASVRTLAVVRPNRERCGVRDYADLLTASFPADVRIATIDFPIDGRRRSWRAAADDASTADAVLVHFEAGLFAPINPYRDHFADLLSAIESPRLVTLHGPIPAMAPRWESGGEAYHFYDLMRDLAYAPFFSTWMRRHYELAEHWIVHEPELAAEASHFLGADRVTHVIHPIPTASGRWQLAECEPATLVTPGFIKPHKGYDELLPVLSARRDWRWILAGGPQDRIDAAYAESLAEELRSRGLTDRVVSTGYLSRERLERETLRAQLAVFPFRHATGSGSIALTIALGMPVAAADVPSVRSLVDAGAGIALLPADQPERWGDALDTLLDDPDRLSALAARNVDLAARATFTACAHRVVAVAEKLAARRQGSR